MRQTNLWHSATRHACVLTLVTVSSLSGADRLHERATAEFSFHLDVPYLEAAPLFGALAEMKWDADWKPEFLYPTPAKDQEGSIFVVSGRGPRSIWTTTVFDLERGRIQYLCFVEGIMVTRIDIHLAKPGSRGTDVRVVYERTALDSSANAQVEALAKSDSHNGPHWKAAIEAAAK